MDKKDNIEQLVVDALLERPITFTLGKKYFYMYPPSVGVTFLCIELVKRLKFNEKMMLISEQFELIRVCTDHRDDVLRLIAIHTFENRKDALYEEKVLARMKELGKLDAAELLTLIVAIFQWSTYEEKFMKHFGLNEEKKRQEQLNQLKKSKNTFTFGGRSLYGTMVDYAAERYGYTIDYILWGISATNLHMMVQDGVKSIFLTDEERKKGNISTDGVVIKADDKRNNDAIRQFVAQKKLNRKK